MTTDIRFQSKQSRSFVKVDQPFILLTISPDLSFPQILWGEVQSVHFILQFQLN